MSFILQLKTRNIDGVLERLLAVVRYRGYSIHGMMAHPSVDGSRLDITLKLQSTSPSHNLSRQIGKLYDVEHVEMYGEIGRQVSMGQASMG